MKVIAITMLVDDDKDIYELHEYMLDQFNPDDPDEIIVYETIDALIADHTLPVLPASLRVD